MITLYILVAYSLLVTCIVRKTTCWLKPQWLIRAVGLVDIIKYTQSMFIFLYYGKFKKCLVYCCINWIHNLKLAYLSIKCEWSSVKLNYLNIQCKISKMCINKQWVVIKHSSQVLQISTTKFVTAGRKKDNRVTCFFLHMVPEPHPFITHWHSHFFQRWREVHDCVHQQPKSEREQKVSCEGGRTE